LRLPQRSQSVIRHAGVISCGGGKEVRSSAGPPKYPEAASVWRAAPRGLGTVGSRNAQFGDASRHGCRAGPLRLPQRSAGEEIACTHPATRHPQREAAVGTRLSWAPGQMSNQWVSQISSPRDSDLCGYRKGPARPRRFSDASRNEPRPGTFAVTAKVLGASNQRA